MKKAFVFVDSLTPKIYEVLGYPTLKFYDGFCEVSFTTSMVIKDLKIFDLSGYDEIRLIPSDNCCLSVVFIIYD